MSSWQVFLIIMGAAIAACIMMSVTPGHAQYYYPAPLYGPVVIPSQPRPMTPTYQLRPRVPPYVRYYYTYPLRRW